MKKTIKFVLALSMAFAVFYSSVSSSYAYMCANCWGGQMVEVCNQDKVLLDQGEHSYGFLGRKVEENLEVYKQNFDVVLTQEDATFDAVGKIILK